MRSVIIQLQTVDIKNAHKVWVRDSKKEKTMSHNSRHIWQDNIKMGIDRNGFHNMG
jgi:hypothetical protein